MLHRRLSSFMPIFYLLILPILISSSQISSIPNQSQVCACLNGGTCPTNQKYIACNCPQGYIGTKCQTKAQTITNIQKDFQIDQSYSYFYFQPKQVNYYQISLKICLPQNNNRQLTNLVFLQVERSSGKLKLQPSIYQTSPLTFEGNEDLCQTFYTHFIPIRKKMNEEYQKIIFGIAIKNNSDATANRWVNFLQKSLSTNPEEPFKVKDFFNENDVKSISQPQVFSQNIKISCTYELYLAENYWGTAIIVMSALTLFISTAVFLYTIRNKYTYTFSNEDILRLYAINPEDFANNQPSKNDLSHFTLIMPIMSYQIYLQKQKRSKKKFPLNTLKRRIQMHFQSKQHENIKEQKNQVDLFSHSESVNKSDQSVVSEEHVCTICLIAFQKQQKIRQTPCRHIFHSQCIDNWCQNTLNCPICRHNLSLPSFMTKKQFRELIQN